jgi:ribonuclease P protein component
MTQVHRNETHFSAQQNQARPHARVPRAHGHQSRAPRYQAPPRERPRTVDAIDQRAPLTAAGTGTNRFEKRHRLLNEADYGRVFRKATRSRDSLFTALCRQNDINTPGDINTPRLGLAIAKKHCRLATGRNRIKRIVRESFRQHQALLAGLDIIVMNQPAAKAASNQELSASLEEHWQRLSKAKQAPQEK